jgi:hypothetical protein
MQGAFVVLVTVFFLYGCSAVTRRAPAVDEGRSRQTLATEAQRTTIDVSDGISQVEAYKIAEEYFLTRNGNICGMVGIPKGERAGWRVPVYEGMIGVHTKDVVIDSKSGSYRIEGVRRKEPNKSPDPTSGLRPSGGFPPTKA